MKERLLDFIYQQRLTVNAFEEKCGLAKGTVSRLNHGMRSDNLASVARVFPNLDVRWLLTGEPQGHDDGMVSLYKTTTEDPYIRDARIKQLENTIEILQKRILADNQLMNDILTRSHDA